MLVWTAALWQLEQHQTQEEGICDASPSLFHFCMRLESASRRPNCDPNAPKKRTYVAFVFALPFQQPTFIHSEKKTKNKTSQPTAGNMRNLRTYSCAPVWVPSLRRRELGSIEPHQRGEGLRHPVGDHRHGAEHDADLQQRHRHLCALLGLLFKPSSFYRLR